MTPNPKLSKIYLSTGKGIEAMSKSDILNISGYSKYNPEAKRLAKINPLDEIYPPLPAGKYDVIYADPPWDYSGKMQYDKSSIKTENVGLKKISLLALQFSSILH